MDDLVNHARWLKDPKQGAKLSWYGEDLSGIDLSGWDLRFASIRNCNLNGSYSLGTSLKYANLFGSTLDNAIIKLTDLSHANLEGCSFKNASMVACDAEGAYIKGAYFGADRGTNIKGLVCHTVSKFDGAANHVTGHKIISNGLTVINTDWFSGTPEQFKYRVANYGPYLDVNTTDDIKSIYLDALQTVERGLT